MCVWEEAHVLSDPFKTIEVQNISHNVGGVTLVSHNKPSHSTLIV